MLFAALDAFAPSLPLPAAARTGLHVVTSRRTGSAAPVVIRFGALGDMVLLTPLLHLLHQRYEQPCKVIGSGAWLAPLYAHHPDVGEVLQVRSRKRPYFLDRSQRMLVSALRAHNGPIYICDDYSREKIRWLLDRAGIAPARRIHANPDCLLGGEEHWIDRWLRFGSMTPTAFSVRIPPARAQDASPAPHMVVNNADRADRDAWLRRHDLVDKPLILLQPGNKRTLKRGRAGQVGDDKFWPNERWAALIRAVAGDNNDARIVLCGVPAETPLLRSIARKSGSSHVHVVSNDLPLRRLMALSEIARGMISVDTGPAHVAAALGCPLVVMYGAGRPAQWLPRSPSDSAVIALGGWPRSARIDDIALSDVLAAWKGLFVRDMRT